MLTLSAVRATRVARSFVAVATSRPMPHWSEYKTIIEDGLATTMRSSAAFADLADIASHHDIHVRGSVADLISALVSFADDHNASIPQEFFPREQTLQFMLAVSDASLRGAWLGTRDQLALALEIANDLWTALLVCHLGIRQLARGRDTRVFGRMASWSVEERCRRGRSVAAFEDGISNGGDPMGDTYHYWANVLAGVASATLGAGKGRAMYGLFHNGPRLMLWIRERTFRSTLFYGTHANVDRLGLKHGVELARRVTTRCARV